MAKRRCFAPAALYRPFGEQAAGVKSLSQFQALQDGEQELASLRELGLTDTEIQLWQSRDDPEKVKHPGGQGGSSKQDKLGLTGGQIHVIMQLCQSLSGTRVSKGCCSCKFECFFFLSHTSTQCRLREYTNVLNANARCSM